MPHLPKIVLATKLKHLQATSLGCEKLYITYGLVVLVGLSETSCEDCFSGPFGLWEALTIKMGSMA